MATQVEAASALNGAKSNGKIKSKNQLRRLKAKQKKAEKSVAVRSFYIYLLRSELIPRSYKPETNGHTSEDVKMEEEYDGPQNVEYVSEQLDVKDPALEAFSDVFARFQLPPETTTVRRLLYTRPL